jgi:hypothetical protein
VLKAKPLPQVGMAAMAPTRTPSAPRRSRRPSLGFILGAFLLVTGLSLFLLILVGLVFVSFQVVD